MTPDEPMSEIPGLEAEVLPTLPAQSPRMPLPGFLLALGLCLMLMLCSFGPALIVGTAWTVVAELLHPGIFGGSGEDQLTQVLRITLPPTLLTQQVMTIAFSLVCLRLIQGKDWKRYVALRRPSAVHLVLALLAIPGFVVIGNGVYELTKQLLPSIKIQGLDLEGLIGALGTLPVGLLLVMMAFGPGIGEELFCRALLGRGLVARYGILVGVLFTSFFFGLIHADPAQALFALVMGAFLHLSYLATRSLLIPIVLHIANNGISVLAMTRTLPQLDYLDPPKSNLACLHYFMAAMVLAAVGVAFYRTRLRLEPSRPDAALLWRPQFPGVEMPPKDSGWVVVKPVGYGFAVGMTVSAVVLYLATAIWVR